MTLYSEFTAKLTELASGDDDNAAVAAAATAFVEEHGREFSSALERFGADGRLLDGGRLPASTYNDFYKWTMLPVMTAVERARPQGVVCTFSANIRDEACRNLLLKSFDGISDPDLYTELTAALEELASRPFDRAMFERAAQDYGLPGFSPEVLDFVCGPARKPRTLASAVRVARVASGDGSPQLPKDPLAVQIQAYTSPCHKLNGARRVYIEATGPWSRVTWLETTLMQAIYDVLFRHRMRVRYVTSGSASDDAWYPRWLATAFVRCMRSCAAAKASGLKGALMTGRRTGGFPFMLCQNILLQKDFRCEDGSIGLIGTSSLTGHYWLLDAGLSPKAVPVAMGTHAHELSMVLGALLGNVDDQAGLPLSQVVAHSLYFYLSLPRGDVQEQSRKRLMPILPDTLGTRAFMATASQLCIPSGVHAGEPVLSVVGTARQDSGSIDKFRGLMDEYEFRGSLMASEVETPADLISARDAGYQLFGAGGFFGDSEKAWDPNATNISMAIKVLRVYEGGSRTQYDPVKIGDTEGGSGEGKLEADGLLDGDRLRKLKERTYRFVGAKSGVEKAQLQKIFEAALDELMADTAGGSTSVTWLQWFMVFFQGCCCWQARDRKME